MSLYDAAKDAIKVAQKADNIELVQKLLDVQKMALDMQEKQHQQNELIADLRKIIADIEDINRYQFGQNGNYLVDQKGDNRPLCPICTRKNNFPIPLIGPNFYCNQCKGYYQ